MEEETWIPKTELGRKVQSKEITDIDSILRSGQPILEQGIVDALLDYDTELLLIGQAKGKFGGGQRRVFKQTQKKTKEGNKPRFTTLAVIGDRNGHVGIGAGKAKETVLAREKALRQAKINIFMITRGSGSWESQVQEPHTIPFSVEGKCGSVRIKLMPAPKGTGLVIEKECAKVLELAGISDIWSRSYGQTKNKINLVTALQRALKKLVKTKMLPHHRSSLYVVDGAYKGSTKEAFEESATPDNVGSSSQQKTSNVSKAKSSSAKEDAAKSRSSKSTQKSSTTKPSTTKTSKDQQKTSSDASSKKSSAKGSGSKEESVSQSKDKKEDKK